MAKVKARSTGIVSFRVMCELSLTVGTSVSYLQQTQCTVCAEINKEGREAPTLLG
jgi:hypothetical protein